MSDTTPTEPTEPTEPSAEEAEPISVPNVEPAAPVADAVTDTETEPTTTGDPAPEPPVDILAIHESNYAKWLAENLEPAA
jgi:hypothetical protein